MHIKFELKSENATFPQFGSEYAAGIDLFSSNEEPIFIQPHHRQVIPTSLAMSYDDPSYYMRIAPRSGLSVNHCIDIGAGVIDYDYRGEIKIVVINNHPTEVFEVRKKMKIAQKTDLRSR